MSFVNYAKRTFASTESMPSIKENHAALIRGSVLDQNNHPSYSPEHVEALNFRDAEYKRRHAELRTELGFDW